MPRSQLARPSCTTCHGTGTVRHFSGGRIYRQSCPDCHRLPDGWGLGHEQ